MINWLEQLAGRYCRSKRQANFDEGHSGRSLHSNLISTEHRSALGQLRLANSASLSLVPALLRLRPMLHYSTVPLQSPTAVR